MAYLGGYGGYYGSYNTPAGAFISGFTEGGRPFLEQIIEERRRKKRKEERSQFITQNLMALDPSIDPARAEAFAKLGGAGVNLPFSQLQPEAPPDLSKIFTDPEDAATVAAVRRGDLDPEVAYRDLRRKQTLRSQIEADKKALKEVEPLLKKFGISAETIRASEFLGRTFSKDLVGKVLFPGDDDDDIDVWQNVKGKSFEELSREDRGALLKKHSPKEIEWAFELASGDKSAEQVAKIRFVAAQAIVKAAPFNAIINQEDTQTAVARAMKEAVAFLEGGGLPKALVPVFEEARAGMGDLTKKEMRDRLVFANDSFNWGLSDDEIELILLELYKRR